MQIKPTLRTDNREITKLEWLGATQRRAAVISRGGINWRKKIYKWLKSK